MLFSASRALTLLALVTQGECEKDRSATGEVPMIERKTPSPDELLRLLDVVEAMRPEDALYLDDVGWFQLQHYKAYDGRNPRTGERVFVAEKTLLSFQPDFNLISALNGRRREDLGDPTDGGPDVVIHRFDWTQSIARTCLPGARYERRHTTIAGFRDFTTRRATQRSTGGTGTRVTEEARVSLGDVGAASDSTGRRGRSSRFGIRLIGALLRAGPGVRSSAIKTRVKIAHGVFITDGGGAPPR